jgi:8-oxo-dGTP diphosphatase
MNKQITIVSGFLYHNGKVLLNLRTEEELPDAHMKWELPGGKIDFGEAPEEAVKREFFEETGVEVRVERLFPKMWTNYWEYPWGTQQTLCFTFLCSLVSEGKRKADHHVADTKWFTLEEAKMLEALPGMKEIVEIAEVLVK